MTVKNDAHAAGTALGEAQVRQFLAVLHEQRAGLLERLGVTDGDDSPVDADPSTTDETLARAAANLEEVEAALGRLEAGTYGRCEACDGPIPFERLEVVPAAARCVSCQTRTASLLG